MDVSVEFSSLSGDDLEGIGLGVSSDIVRIRNTNIAAKRPALSPALGPKVHEIERQAYEPIGDHPYILRYIGQSPPECKILKSALLFEYHPRGTLRDHIKGVPSDASRRCRFVPKEKCPPVASSRVKLVGVGYSSKLQAP